MKHISYLLLLLLAAMALPGFGQVNVSLTLRPPFSAYIKDYYHLENKAIIVLTNTTRTTQEVKLGGSISNESRGVYIRTTPDYMPPVPITLAPGSSVTLSANGDLMRFFDQGNIATNANDAMLANIIRTGTLPEGMYQVCVNAYDYRSGRQLSNTGMGCFSFSLSLADPPLITFPQNNHTYPAEQKNLNFSWTPPLGNLAGSLIEYDQVVVKVQPGQNPNDAIAAARDFKAGNPVLDKRSTLSQTYITQPYDLPFEAGKYAMQVVARDRNQKVLLNNQGRSEIVVFEVGKAMLNNLPDLEFSERETPTFTNTQLKGTLRYYWQGVAGSASNYNNFGNVTTPPAGGSGSSGTTPNGMQYSATDQNISIQHNGAGFSGWQNSPLSGVTVQLVKATQYINAVAGGSNAGAAPDLLMGSLRVDNVTVLATATTTTNGSFSFNVPNISSIDFGWKNNVVSEGGGNGEFNWTLSGPHRTVLMVRVTSGKYYANPVQFISGIPGNGDMGKFYSRVHTFNARVQVTDNDNRTLTKPNLEVLFLRKEPRNMMAPRDEGHPGNFSSNPRTPSDPTSYEIVYKSTGVTNGNGEVLVQNILLENCGSYGRSPFFVRTRIKDEFNTNLSLHHFTNQHVYATRGQWNDENCVPPGQHHISSDCGEMNCLTIASLYNRYSTPTNYTPVEFFHLQGVWPIKARVYGQVKSAIGGDGDDLGHNLPSARWCLWQLNVAAVQNAKTIAADGKWGLLAESAGGFSYLMSRLYDKGTPMTMLRTGLTANDGRVDEDLLPYDGAFDNPTGFYYLVSVEKTGFEMQARAVNYLSGQSSGAGDVGIAMPGNAYKLRDFIMEPKGKVRLKLVNEQGTVIDGSAWYYDPATGMEGTAEEATTTVAGQTQLLRINLDVPSGNNRKIIVQPENSTLYARDTITVNVPSNETLVKEVVIKYKLHRIYINVKNTATGDPVDHAKVELLLSGDEAVMYNNLQSPWLYEGAHSNMPPPNLPGNGGGSNNPPNNNSPYQSMSDNSVPELVGPYTKFTNNGGGVDFAFRNSGTSFKFRITGPEGTFDYVVKEKTITSIAGSTWKKVNVTIAMGRNVSGTVMFGQVPVANARVRVKDSSPQIEVFTNSQGRYTMQGVPIEPNLTFTASKQGYLGMTFTEGQATQSAYGAVGYESGIGNILNTTINFTLRIYDGLDLSKLLGFPLEVTELEESRPVRISGLVTVKDSANAIFKIRGNTAQGKRLSTIDFSDLTVVADNVRNDSGIPYCRPQTLPVRTDINEQPIRIYNFYDATLYDATNGITLNHYGSGNTQQGAAQGRVRVEPSSFNDNSIGLANGQTISLVNGNSMQFPVFTSNGPAVVNAGQGIGIANESGAALQYTLHDFTAIASAGTSKLYKDSVMLDTRLQTNLAHVTQPNFDLPIGKLKINKQRVLEDVTRNINVDRKLDSFKLHWSKIYVNERGIHFDGMLTAAGMNMPVADAQLFPTEFLIPPGTLQTNNAKLLNAIPLTVTSNASFGYDGTRPVPAWYLAITSNDNDVAAAEISGQYLNGLSSSAKIPLTSIWFYSNGDQYVTLRSNLPAYRVNNIANFSLQSILLNSNMLTLSGAIDMGIPSFPNYNTGLLYEKNGTNTVSNMMLQAFPMPDIPVNGVVLAFNNGSSSSIQMSNGQLQVRGRVRDENPEVFKNVLYTLTKTNAETKLVLDETPQKQQIKLGGSSSNSRIILSNIEGRMWVTNNAWNHLYFNGDMPEDMGFTADGKRMRFDVMGSLSVNNQSVKLKNIETPFGNLNMVYDMEMHRLMGNLHFSNKVGTMAIQGDAELVVDKLGYYFMAGGSMEMHNPRVEGSTYMLFGDYDHKASDRRGAIESMLKEYSYYYQNLYELPNGYLNMDKINGFFFEAGASIPFPALPNFDVDLLLVSAALEVNVGGDVRVGINFGETNQYNMGLGVFVNARLKLAASGGIVCEGVEVTAKAGVDIDGTYKSNGDYDLVVQGYATLKGRAWFGGGPLCTADCAGACGYDEISGQVGVKAIGTVTNNHSSFELVFDASNNTF